ncbi:peroxide stress protein YaaA [uncultured Agrococcus sp.]|uniref:peroxide stress protein YaaA n=1 Tax=uncultured Agrococcus sp. TaxID=382258 RepID=UPI0025FDB1AF|nr:peroxide stress protein YaaA [uncultured Agrococcus sp.]
MLILLPPSETKVSGGSGTLSLASLGFPGLASGRSAALDAVAALVAAGQDESSPAKARAAAANRTLLESGTLPAIERYTGVLFDGLGYRDLDAGARTWVNEHVAIGSALFGLVRASDGIPDYKISHNTKVPGTTLARIWRRHTPLELPGMIVDMRSKAYAALLPVEGAVPVDVVDDSGRALAHWNKHGKGRLVRDLARAGIRASAPAELAERAGDMGVRLDFDGESLTLITEPVVSR